MSWKSLTSGLVLALASLQTAPAQEPAKQPEELSPDTVVAVLDGEPFTVAEIERVRKTLPSQYAKQTAHMSHRQFLEQYRQLLGFERAAKEAGLPEKEPFRTQFEFNSMNYWAQVYLTQITSRLTVSEEDLQDYYDRHKEDFEQLRVSAIYLDYSQDAEGSEGEEQAPSEQQARDKAEGLVEKLRGGADFAGMARKHSTDAGSADKGGDLGEFNRSSNIPDPLKRAIFELKEGEVSDPILHAGRFYIFKVTERNFRPLDQVKDQIRQKVRGEKLRAEIDKIREQVPAEYEDVEFLKEDMKGVPIMQPRLSLGESAVQP